MSRGVATLSLDSDYLAERAVARRTESECRCGLTLERNGSVLVLHKE